MARLPLIEDLTRGPVSPGTQILVEFDSAAQWYNASITIAAGWLKDSGKVFYTTYAQPLNDIRLQLQGMGLSVENLENDEALQIYDGYTLTLGQKSKERHAFSSLKVADLSIWMAKDFAQGPPIPDMLAITDSQGVLGRFMTTRLGLRSC